MDGHVQRVFSVQWHPTDSHLLASGGWDDTVQFWDDRAPHAVRYLMAQSQFAKVGCLRLTGSSTVLTSVATRPTLTLATRTS